MTGRRNIVLSRTLPPAAGITVVKNLEELKALGITSEEIFVIGGAEVYRLLLPECDTLILTRVHRVVEGDTFFPPFEKEFRVEKVLLEAPEYTIQEWVRV